MKGKYLWIVLFAIFPSVIFCQTTRYATLFWDLYDAVSLGSRILHDVTDGVGAVSKAIKAIDSLLDKTENAKSADKTATSKTTVGGAQKASVALPDVGGCGALSIHIKDDTLPIGDMVHCCDSQESCYASACLVNKRECDSVLRMCLFSVCEQSNYNKTHQSNCRGAAKILFSGTMALSFQHYNEIQLQAGCVKKPHKEKKERARDTKAKRL